MSKVIRQDGRVIHPQTSLTRTQKEAVGLLSIGTFLEYFDLMLYVHMAVLLNELFFPKTEPYTAKLLAAAAFCSTYLMRPFGALIFGWIGDTIGRKATVVITTSMMSLSCIIMASLPTYSQIGITATWIVTICRIIQGMSSMGEIVGAELYITEMVLPPKRYPTVAVIGVAGTLGGSAALAVASMMTSFNFNWRIAFFIGACIAIIGAVARSSLRETTDFVNAKKRLQNIVKTANLDITTLKSHIVWKEQVSTKTIIAYFLIECTGPIWFCITYIYCGNILRQKYLFSAEQVIHQNFIVSLIEMLSTVIITYLIFKMHPIKLLKIKFIIFSIVAMISPILLNNISSPVGLLYFQVFVSVFGPTGFPAFAVFCIYFPVLKRFTCTSVIFASSRALAYAIATSAIIYLGCCNEHFGLLYLIIPILIGYGFGISHFTKLEKEAGNYH